MFLIRLLTLAAVLTMGSACTPTSYKRVKVVETSITPVVRSGTGRLSVSTYSSTVQIDANYPNTVVGFQGGVAPYTVQTGSNCVGHPQIAFSVVTLGMSFSATASGTCTLVITDALKKVHRLNVTALEPFATSQVLTSTSVPRSDHTATVLPSGKVLIIGGDGNGTSVEIYDPSANANAGTQTTLTALPVGVTAHSAHLLTSGQVMIAGGNPGGGITNVQRYDANGAGSVTAMNPLSVARANHSTVQLPNGKIIFIGGVSGFTVSNSVELYDPYANSGMGSSTVLTSLSVARQLHSATLLPNGKILVVGGINAANAALNSVELYDPSGAGATTTLTHLQYARSRQYAHLLANGKVLLAAGVKSDWVIDLEVTSEIYDPSGSGSTLTATPLSNPSVGGVSIQLEDGRILFAGGFNTHSAGTYYGVELFDPTANAGVGRSTILNNLQVSGALFTGSVLPNGKVLFVGGNTYYGLLNRVEIFSFSYK